MTEPIAAIPSGIQLPNPSVDPTDVAPIVEVTYP